MPLSVHGVCHENRAGRRGNCLIYLIWKELRGDVARSSRGEKRQSAGGPGAGGKNGGGTLVPPPGLREGRYGRLTVVESPEAEIVNVPVAVEL